MLPGLRLVIAGILFAVVFPMIAFGVAANFRSANGTTLSPFATQGVGPAQPEYYWSQLYAPARIRPADSVRDGGPVIVAAVPTMRNIESDAPRPFATITAAQREAIAAQPIEMPRPIETPKANELAVVSEPAADDRPKTTMEADARGDMSASESIRVAAIPKIAEAPAVETKPAEPPRPVEAQPQSETPPSVEAARPPEPVAPVDAPAHALAIDGDSQKRIEGLPPADANERAEAAKSAEAQARRPARTQPQRIARRTEALSSMQPAPDPVIPRPEERSLSAAPELSVTQPVPPIDEKPQIVAATNPLEAEIAAESEYDGESQAGLIDPVPLPTRRPVISHASRSSSKRSRPPDSEPFVPLRNSLFEALFGGISGPPFLPPTPSPAPPAPQNRAAQLPFFFPPRF